MNKHTPIDLVPPTVMVGIDQLRYASEAPPELNLEVRKSSDKVGLGELEASIRTHGVIVPLVTKEHKGKLYVTAGNRRLKLLRKIHGANGPEVLVPTIDSDKIKGDSREIAMATNLGLPPHPVDRYEVISLLVKEGMSPDDAQARFDLTPQAYGQVMRLGKMAPVIRDAWRNEEIGADVVKAFALTDDIKEQEKVFSAVKKNAYRGIIHAHEVASRFVGQQREAGPLVEFVGIAACEKAKLKVNTDLFGTRHTVNDMRLLRQLADKKMSEACEALVKEGGWAWAAPESDLGSNRWQYGRIDPASEAKPTPEEKTRIEEIENSLTDEDNEDDDLLDEELDRIRETIKARGYTAEQRKKSGCILKITNDGKLSIEYGSVKPEEKKRVEAAERRTTAAPAAGKKKSGPKSDVKSAALAQRLSAALTKAAATTVVRDTKVGVAALIAGFASRDRAVGVHISGDIGRPASFVPTFEGNLKGSAENLFMLLSQICGRALHFGSGDPDAPPLKRDSVKAICDTLNPKLMNAALRDGFDAKDYFGSIDKEPIFQAVLESMGDEHANRVAKMKRGEAAAFAIANVPKTGWLPPWLRTAHYDGPTFKAAKKKGKPAAKAAAKKTAKKKAKR